MLPDFLAMLRLRTTPRDAHQGESELGRGMAFHHVTDHVFHDSPAFQALSRDAFAALLEAGLARGPSRALAHIGIELLLDETPEMKALGASGYLAALAYGRESGVRQLVSESGLGEAGASLEALLDLLATRGVRAGKPTLPEVCERLRRALANRPRLAFSPRDDAQICAWLAHARSIVATHAPLVLSEVWAGLAARGYARTQTLSRT